MSHSNARRRTRHAAVALSLALAAGSVLASEPDATWLAAIEQEIARAEYEITWQTQTVLEDLTAAWHAPNRAQGFRTYFADEGIRMVPRSEESPAWEWRLSLFGWGRPGAVEAVEAAVLRAEANRIEYDRGDILEWYVNDARGLEQGFTLEGPPPGAESSWVWIELALGGTLLPVLSADGQAIDFQTADGMRAIHYAQLRVTDATEQALPARMEGRDGGIRLVFDDQEAVYPVTVDPLATGASWTAESNQANAFFGAAVATAGDVNADGFSDVVVGAYFYDNGQADEGRAFVYHGSAAGLATTVAWTAESNQGSAEFGTSVATAGDVNGDGFSDVIVGAVLYGNDQANEGRAFVYHGSAGGLATSASWTAESNQGIARFGQSVATAGDVNGDGFSDVIVGAYGYDNGQMNEGRAFAYHGSAAGLASGAAWTAESDQASANFGWSVATAGDVNGDGCADVAVGAYLYDNGQTDEGRTFVYHGSAAGLAANAAWTAESNQANASFGWSVATAGDVNGDGFSDTIVGAHLYENGQTNEGSAFVYHGSIAGLSTSASQTVEGNQTNANLGSSVATAGDVNGDGFADVIVGAPLYDNVEANEGRAFVYRGSAAGLVTTAIWKAESDQSNAHLGSSVATAGDVNGDGYSDVIAGAPFYDGGQTDEGRASVYHGSAGGLNTSASQTAESNQANAQFGFSVAAAGDVNGDGFADVIVGANGYDNGETNEGRAFVHHGSAAGLETTAAWMAESDQVAANFGYSVATAGDVNGDGFSDVIVGAFFYDNDQTNEGRAFVYHGSATGLAPGAAWTAESNQASANFGASVATAGDVNGDGFSDVIVGAFFYDNDQTNEGRAFVYHGSAAGLAPDAAWTAEGDQGGADFGLSVATAGDVNGDGFSDVIVGAHLYDNGQTNEGRAFVYQGSATGLAPGAAWTAESNQASANFGASVATAGDVNGDGYSDAIVGAHLHDNDQTNEGRTFVYHGSAAGLAPGAAWTAESDQANARLGISVATAGDVNGDGYSDVIAGAYLYDNGETDEGRALVYHGSAAGLTPDAVWTVESNQVNANLGIAVATAGDVNGDGYSDVIAGAYLYDNGETDEGRAFVYQGSAAGLLSVPSWTAESDQADANLGGSVAPAGDVNGDGFSEVVVGAYLHNNGQTDEGRASLYYGNGGPGLTLRPQQRHPTDTGPIAHLGLSDGSDSFRLALLGRSPFGRGRVTLESEVKPLGVPFDGSGTSVGVNWTDSGTAGTPLNDLALGLAGDTVYHWRVRLLYYPPGVPFQRSSRWLTVPWRGWQEAMLRTPLPAAGVDALEVDKAGGGQITLIWAASCLATDTDYAVYEGTLGDFTTHGALFCDTGGATTKTFTPAAGSAYYLVTALNGTHEGSYGTTSAGAERPLAASACLPQQVGACP